MSILLNVRLPHRSELYCLEIVGNQLRSMLPMAKVAANAVQAIDCQGDWVSLGGVDLQINGALGMAFPDLSDPVELQKAASFLWAQGIDAFTPTLVTADAAKIQRSLAVIRAYQAMGSLPRHAEVLGAHLEGPFLNSVKRGAHPAGYLQPLSIDRVQKLLGEYVDGVKIVTLAPEMAETAEVIPWLRSHNITVSLGHSLATAAQAQEAFDQGASMITHAFNAMPGLHHREPGLLGAALTHPRVFTGLIADGQHVCPTMLDLLLRVGRGSNEATHGGLFLVSDALAPLGLPDGTYPWDSREIEVIEGTARLPDGTLSGTTRLLLDGVKNLVKWGVCSVDEAISMATDRPRQAIDLPRLAPMQTAHLLRWHYDGTDLSWQRM
ncbi:N-acetylglucosamine-6-phosphate deacetylase [Leptolyngbya cf. ectocarpi LEGE 11479]|uniref:N-acetylglucosamine-6-phosphate deacetylase n=1 Tax=Leptolyngbya cf. ectocarpi LEGE 11479 TaxID=1828722 RepID=A0A928ZTX0_LEPEC|nr:N-acetylglucosamine-6-phosphate deacetylase [Leptolyngbya ectocarpi]MBE9067379.1 N-acetylglucosamine-6-phosphate deacetylase [Leptolyngbya cf. ectocarpi LEGE 11479]